MAGISMLPVSSEEEKSERPPPPIPPPPTINISQPPDLLQPRKLKPKINLQESKNLLDFQKSQSVISVAPLTSKEDSSEEEKDPLERALENLQR